MMIREVDVIAIAIRACQTGYDAAREGLHRDEAEIGIEDMVKEVLVELVCDLSRT